MATILIHPTLACSPCQAEAFQARHGLLMVISGNVVKAVPALHYRTPPTAPTRPAHGLDGR